MPTKASEFAPIRTYERFSRSAASPGQSLRFLYLSAMRCALPSTRDFAPITASCLGQRCCIERRELTPEARAGSQIRPGNLARRSNKHTLSMLGCQAIQSVTRVSLANGASHC
jgi:hypothetical protein